MAFLAVKMKSAPRGCGRGPPAWPKGLREDTESHQCCCWFECCTARNAPWSSDETQCRPTRSGIDRPAGETTSILPAFAAAPPVPHQAHRRTIPAKSRPGFGECGCRTESEPFRTAMPHSCRRRRFQPFAAGVTETTATA